MGISHETFESSCVFSITKNILRDRTGLVQVVIEPSLIANMKITTESVVEICGVVKQEHRSKTGYELLASNIKILSLASELPLTINQAELTAPLEIVLYNRTLSLRYDKINPIFKIQASLVHAFQAFLNEEGFVQVFTPKIVASGTEGGNRAFCP